MAIPSLAEAKAAVFAVEIAPYEADITKYLEQENILEFLSDTAQTNRTVIRTFPGQTLSVLGIDALKASITAAGWTSVTVVNGFEPPRQGIGSSGAPARPMVTVSFAPPAAGGATQPDGE